MKKTIALLLALSAVSIVSLDASAADDKTMPGMTCVQTSGGIPVADRQGRLVNPTTTGTYVACPIVRDDAVGQLDWVTVSVLDVSNVLPNPDFACRAISVSRDTNDLASYGPYVSSAGVNTVSYQKLGLPTPGDYDFGSFFIECFMPPTGPNGSSSIVSWSYGES